MVLPVVLEYAVLINEIKYSTEYLLGENTLLPMKLSSPPVQVAYCNVLLIQICLLFNNPKKFTYFLKQ